MLWLTYLFFLLVGGFFVGMSVLGGDSDEGTSDHDGDVAVDNDADIFPDHHDTLPERYELQEKEVFAEVRGRRWRPWLSFRFYTFSSCFFGLTGVLLTLSPWTPGVIPTFVLSLVTGAIAGVGVSYTIYRLQDGQADSLVRGKDLLGASGVVDIALERGSRGKVIVTVKGGQSGYLAVTDEVETIARGERVLVVGLEGERLRVVSERSIMNNQHDTGVQND